MNYLGALCKQILESGSAERSNWSDTAGDAGRRAQRRSFSRAIEAAGAGVGLLAVDAPIAQFLERDGLSGDCAAHEGAWAKDAKVAVKILDFRFARVGRAPFEPVHSTLTFATLSFNGPTVLLPRRARRTTMLVKPELSASPALCLDKKALL